ncbi:MAG: DNA primase, partial [Chloroflexota bacterium]
CFGCGKGGDVFSFVMELGRVSFREALVELAGEAGVSLEEPAQRKPSLKNRLFEANQAAAAYYAARLHDPSGEPARRYLQSRKFGDDAIGEFELGYAPRERDGLVQHLREKGFDDRIILSAGLALQSEQANDLRDRFHHRVILPIQDASGRITGLGGRALGDDHPKYLNSPQTEIFDKSSVLFGIHQGLEAIRKAGRAVLVEGYLDVIRAHACGFGYTVASLGTAVTTGQLGGLARVADSIVICLDPDPAGRAAAARAALVAWAEVANLGKTTIDLRVARLNESDGDPDELIRDRPADWERIIDSAVPAFDFYFEEILAGLDRSSDAWRQQAVTTILPVIQRFASSAGWQAAWIERLAAATGVEVRALQRSLPAGRSQPTLPRAKQVTELTGVAVTVHPAHELERALLASLLREMFVSEEAVTLLAGIHFEPTHDDLKERLLDWNRKKNYDFALFRESLAPNVQALADSLRNDEKPGVPDGKETISVAVHLARWRRFKLDEGISRVRHLAANIGEDDRPAAAMSLAGLLSEQFKIERTLDDLSKAAFKGKTASEAVPS